MNEGENLQGEALPEDSQLIAQPDAEEAESSTAENSEGEQETEETPQKQRKPGIQRRLDELTANWREEQRTRQKLEAMLERVLSERQQPEPPKAQEQPKVEAEPQLDQFQTYEEYVKALARFEARQERAAWAAEQKAREEAQQRQSVQTEFQRRVEAFKAEAPDFDMVALNPSLPVSDAMAEAINASDMGPQVLYYLGKNPQESARIAALPPIQAARELGKLELKISLPQPKTVTSAPKPVVPLDGGGSSRAVDPDKMSTEEWLAWRNQTLSRK